MREEKVRRSKKKQEEVREKLIDEIEGLDWYHVNKKGKLVHGSNSEYESYWKCTDVMAVIERVLNDATDTNVGDKWVSVDERLPEETDSIFEKFYGTEKWDNAMFRKSSNDVLVCIEYEDGSRKVGVAHTCDGEWNLRGVWKMKITHWCPFPQPPKEVQ